MFLHFLKLIWKRKARNLMLSLEILLAFMVVFTIAAFGVRNYQLYQLPLGFSYTDIWTVEVRASENQLGKTDNKDTKVYSAFQQTLAALPEIEQVAFASHSPYTLSTWRSDYYLTDSRSSVQADMMTVDDNFFNTTAMSLVEGRWFSGMDEGAAETALVINQQMAEQLFPGQSAVGQVISEGKPGEEGSVLLKITGVFTDFRNKGELMSPTPFAMQRISVLTSAEPVSTLMLKLKAGTSRAFEAKLNQQLKLVRPDWNYYIAPLTDLRRSQLTTYLIPTIVLAVLAVFLLLMVAFGLFGVLWQNITQRIPEIGLRRAVGASSTDIYWQIIWEQLLLSSLAMAVGLILLVQLPLLGVFGDELNWTVFVLAALLSCMTIYFLSLICALYPGWRASRLSPTQALHYE